MTEARPCVLFAWELGANFGHVSKFGHLAERLSDRTDVVLSVREPAGLRQMFPDLEGMVLPAPFARTRGLPPGDQSQVNFAAMLSTEGWHDEVSLGALVEAWQSLFDLVKPDVLVAQAAPTALLAARGRGMRTAILGSGYDNPPLADPMPPFDFTKPELVARAREEEAQVIKVANAVLARGAQPPITAFREILDTDLSLLVAFDTTDHYAPRAALQPDHPPYLGHVVSKSAGAEYHWKDGTDGSRIFAYLRPGSPPAAAAFGALHALGADYDILLAAPGIPDGDAAKLRQRGVRVEPGPIQLEPILEGCDLGISHASNGVCAAFLKAGIAQIGLPGHREQSMLARTLARQGLALGIEGRFGAKEVGDMIQKALSDTGLKARSQAAVKDLEIRFAEPAESLATQALSDLIFSK